MIFDKCLALIFSLMMLGQAYVVRRAVGTWLFPACLFGLFWFAATFVPLLLLVWVPVNPFSVLFILIGTLVFSAGCIFFDWKSAFQKNALLSFHSSFLRRALYLAVALSFVFLALDFRAQGFTLAIFFDNLQTSAMAYADLLYSETLDTSFFYRIEPILAYLSVIFGGLIMPSAPTKKSRAFISALAFLPCVFIAVAETNKGLLLFCVAFFYAGVLVHRICAGKFYLLEKGSGKKLLLVGCTLFVILTIAFLWRGQLTDNAESVQGNLVSYYASYSSAHVYAFSDWFSAVVGAHHSLPYPKEGLTLGFYTFMPVFQLLGSHKTVPAGVFDQYFSESLLSGNIYTFFRGLITDFGFGGSLVFLFLVGVLLHGSFHFLLLRKSPFHVAVFVFMVGFIYGSFIVSALIWTRIWIAFALLWVVLQINERITRTNSLDLKVRGAAGEVAALP